MPQGSILEPLLFIIIAFNYLHTKVRFNFILCAPDNTLFCKSSDLDTLDELVDGTLNMASNWYRTNSVLRID